jgi:hypothetical protein
MMGREAPAGRAGYRLGQGLRALVGRPDDAERAAALAWLPGPARVVFRSWPPAYQCHHLAVFRRLWCAGCRDSDVLAAALLHDMGKIDGRRQVGLWQRTLVVLIQGWPWALERLSEPPAPGWRYGFYLHRHHPEIGAAQAAALGCSPRTVALIAAHQDGDLADAGLIELRTADDGA